MSETFAVKPNREIFYISQELTSYETFRGQPLSKDFTE